MVLELNRAEGQNWSDRDIARRCHVHHVFVGKLRRESSLVTVTSDDVSTRRTYTSKTGTTTVMNTENIGRRERGSGNQKPRAAWCRDPRLAPFRESRRPVLPGTARF